MKNFWQVILYAITSFFFPSMGKGIKKKKTYKLDLDCDVVKMKRFLECMRPFADFENFNRWAIFTHAWHESGAFQKAIGNNYFGIKKPRNWTGETAYVTTHEYIGGVKTKVKHYFADWKTLPEALVWYGGLIQRLYSISFNNRENPENYFIGFTAGRFQYATDPKYVEKLTALYNKLRKSGYIKNLVEQ